jgi:O-methyltransferase
MRARILKLYWLVLNVACAPFFLRKFFQAKVGCDYNVRLLDKIRLLVSIMRNVRKIPGATSWWEHLLLVETVLSIPPLTKGVVVECGCFNGSSTASLSLACSLTGRKLKVFDSFEGLPDPLAIDVLHHLPHYGEIHHYVKGTFRASVESVKRNLERFGCLDACDLVPGFFDETLPSFSEECALVFLDVDLRSSLETCLRYLFPLLQEGCKLFTHEAHHLEIAQVFFDSGWWAKNVGSTAPGLIGAGTGLAFNASFGSAIGYTIKELQSQNMQVVRQDGKSAAWGAL